MEFSNLVLKIRDKTGKGPSRRIRKTGLVPGIIYGRDVQEPIKVALDINQLKKAIEGKYKRNTVLKIIFEGDNGKEVLAMLQDYQIHPATRKIIHVDFITVNPQREIEVNVPIKTTGKPIGVTKGGILMEILHELPIVCLPEKIPVDIELDVSQLDIGQSLKVSSLKLPEGIRTKMNPEQPIVSITTVKEEKEAEVAAAVEGEAKEAPVEGEKAEKKEAKGGEEKQKEATPAKGKDKEKDKGKDKKQ